MSTDAATLASAIGRVAADHAWVELCVLFGSGAKGRLGPASDVDVGWLGAPPPGGERDLARALERALGRDVHLVDLRRAGQLLGAEVVRTGRVAFARRASAWTVFAGEAIARWLDFAPTVRVCAAAVRQRALAAAPDDSEGGADG